MGIFEKAKLLAETGRFDSCGPKSCEIKINNGLGGVYNAKAENSNCKLFKTLMSNKCAFDCKYCINSSCRNRKVSYEPEELARVFNHLREKVGIQGLFLSSAVEKDADFITEKMINAVELVRFKYNFKGYVHFKILPGTSYELIKRASELADRLSINIEAPNKSVLSELSSCKNYQTDILRRQAWISKLTGNQTTQMIVSNFATDKEILSMMKWEYEKLELKRVYFSAFTPVKGTALENEKAVKKLRENRLYNVDFLIRKYGFSFQEIEKVFDNGMLPDEDPKLVMARKNFSSPLDVNNAGFEDLIRIPGIGMKTASRVLERGIKGFNELRRLRIPRRAEPFIKVNGERQKTLSSF